ncbi:MAG: hypothetical protein KJ989_13195 [Gammaproteobacteria bacterium]|uniref:Phage-related protein n=1 Tax=viral metagenome TaxID=1070528 RepID=A0A6M3KKQ7_9ZZZZ|nr:hypothetical protein [Gammaproteobacteria bacterium]MBU2157170.1 hypothetical protein [Gammaproteobacteria bacterium]MBU2256084.1 hypothetical protein [Gammaproteobacteria bacterium]MBU2295152.1 hypothetical protein [Gammaproteobacteria bacterium]
MPTEKPILFNGPMVRAILSGQKTVTRRVLKNQMLAGWGIADPAHPLATITSAHPKKGKFSLLIRREIYPDSGKFEHDVIPSPYGKPGDRLWVREAWARIRVAQAPDQEWVVYREGDNRTDYGGPWKPGIHMFRKDCRLLLEITAVRVERLQDISEAQARAEGISPISTGRFHCGHDEEGQITSKSPVTAFAWLWNSINGEGGWAENPWVWVVEFKRVTQ